VDKTVGPRFDDMEFNQRVEWAKGHLLISIGGGKFESAMWLICNQFATTSFREGFAAGKAEGLAEAKTKEGPTKPWTDQNSGTSEPARSSSLPEP
jgi:hypothetical protein